MVKANSQPAEKTHSPKKQATAKKRASLAMPSRSPEADPVATTAVHVCKINSCNKQFAREADLKRHQRTTKSHSLPGFKCPQCDAAFTRTDALRRHQKSRHNGVVIEPEELQQTEDPPEASGSKSTSPTPSSRCNETLTGRSYYRQHTVTGPSLLVQPVMGSQFQVGLPTSATRLNTATNWSSPSGIPKPPWASQGQTSFPATYIPSRHYRSTVASSGPLAPAPPIVPYGSSTVASPAATGSRADTPVHLVEHKEKIRSATSEHCVVDDPSTQNTTGTTADAHHQVTDNEAKTTTRSATKAGEEDVSAASGSTIVEAMASRDDQEIQEKTNQFSVANTTTSLHAYQPMEHMLTEDGEPMLNPAELLTQESLASPPPS